MELPERVWCDGCGSSNWDFVESFEIAGVTVHWYDDPKYLELLRRRKEMLELLPEGQHLSHSERRFIIRHPKRKMKK
jgi:hypothetical protein